MNTKNSKFSFIDTEMERLASKRRIFGLRKVTPSWGVKVKVGGRAMINFCSNDYLGLSKHPLARRRAVKYLERYGNGVASSRVVCGTYDFFEMLEKKLAKLLRTESSLVFNTGYQAIVSILPTLADRNSLILSDWLNHGGLNQGAMLSRCQTLRYFHNDTDHLRSLLEQAKKKTYSRILIVTESVFGTEGDRCEIDKLADLAAEFGAILIVDEAHAIGVFGEKGMGLSSACNVDISIISFGNAMGSFGSCVACSKKIRNYIINCCPGFIHSNALPPSVAGCIDAALDLIPSMDDERVELRLKAEFLRSSFLELGWGTENSTTQIIPVIIGNEKKTLAISNWLEEHGVLAIPVLPPAVQPGKSRICLTLTSLHTWENVERLLDAFEKWRG